jgi:hypothetical protein
MELQIAAERKANVTLMPARRARNDWLKYSLIQRHKKIVVFAKIFG